MKTLKITSVIVVLLAFTACKKDNAVFSKVKEVKEAAKNTTEAVNNATNILSSVNEAKEKVEKLKNLKPVTTKTIKTWMPDELGDLERQKYKIGNAGMVNISSMTLDYRNPDNMPKNLKVEIIDGAGAGSGLLYMYTMIEKATLDSETENGYEKIHKRDGIAVKERYRKQKYSTHVKMEFLVNDRFAVNARGNNIEPDEFWEYMKALKLDELKE